MRQALVARQLRDLIARVEGAASIAEHPAEHFSLRLVARDLLEVLELVQEADK